MSAGFGVGFEHEQLDRAPPGWRVSKQVISGAESSDPSAHHDDAHALYTVRLKTGLSPGWRDLR